MIQEAGKARRAEDAAGSREERNPGAGSKRKDGISLRLAVWGLLAECTFYKILAVLALMAVLELSLIYRNLTGGERGNAPGATAGGTEGITGSLGAVMHSPEVMAEVFGSVIFPAALGLVFLILIWTEGALDRKSGNTLMRLRVTGKELFTARTVYNMCCLWLVFAVQTALAFVSAELYRWTLAPGAAPQLLFLSFYRSEFLHCLLPMAEAGKWVRNFLMLAALGMEAAAAGGRRRQAVQAGLYIMTAVWFTGPMGMNYRDIICMIAYICVIAADLAGAGIFRREETRREEV